MITIYRSTESGLTIMDEPSPGCWMNVIDPTPDEISHLQDLGVPQDFITYPLDIDERARMEREDGEILIVVRIPFFQGENVDVPYITMPLGIIVTENFILTVCKRNNDILEMFTSGRIRNISTLKKNRFTLRLLLSIANRYLAYLREITKIVDELEDRLQRSTRNREVLELLKYEKSLNYFTTALKSNELMMERLQRSQLLDKYPDDLDWLEDVLTENQQAIEMTTITTNNLSSMMDAFASIISNNLNVVMKFLASVTIVLSIPTIIASLFGMNVLLPFQEHQYAFLFVLGITMGIGILVVIIFWKRDWF